MLINSNPNFEPNYTLSHNQCPELKKDQSYISAYTIFIISDREMVRRKSSSLCILSKSVLFDLIEFFNSCENMTNEDKNCIIDSLVDAVR